MGRNLRIDGDGAWHHVMNRGSGRRLVFLNDGERQRFVGLVGSLEDIFGLEVHAYCLMGNHFHLMVRSSSSCLSEAMQWLSSNFTRAANGRRRVDGSIFRGRFHSVPITRDGHLKYLCGYIHANPQDLGWDRPLEQYPWSSLPVLTGDAPMPPWLKQSIVPELFAGSEVRLRDYVESFRTDHLATRVAPERLEPLGLGGSPRIDDRLAEIAESLSLARGLPESFQNTNAVGLALVMIALDAVGCDRESVCRALDRKDSSIRSSLSRARSRFRADPQFASMIAHSLRLLREDAAVGV